MSKKLSISSIIHYYSVSDTCQQNFVFWECGDDEWVNNIEEEACVSDDGYNKFVHENDDFVRSVYT